MSRTPPAHRRPRAALAMGADAAAAVLSPGSLAALAEVCTLAPLPAIDDFTTEAARAVLADTEVLVTGWGCPPIHAGVLAAAPELRAVVHTAGTVRGHVTDACWDRGIEVSSAAAANALPVAEYTLAMILLSGKRVLERARDFRATRVRDAWLATPPQVGNYRRTVGILSASLIGRRVIELLRPYDLRVLLHDPYVTDEEAAALGVRPVGLAELFAESDVVSVHTPLLPATTGLVSRALLTTMRPDAVLINTSRGAVVDQDALTDVLRADRVRAVIDVTDPDPLPADHPLWDCDNAVITPHLAGSQGNELRRLADLAVGEVARWAAGDGFAHPVRRERLAFLA
ncbi:hydroxyacid dehydrogenase [Streptomyces sp. NPDC053741]|uniref:D-isomer specific 2-hydroxyacid dehydrogenase NAD-binding protein n=2 Tax=Streptomyces TaxID=1883 RepID=A0A8D4B9Y9_STRFA|nr:MULTISPECIES: hydroxyacid dehydrogenase [Streptomyces]MDF9868765.1 phosphoglycerate dehydrogenase-like enzyme [Streptomyces pratensis]RAS35129.1 phosphoglycerate dehydrogenase-like enzyme [Streptomyces avidinii]TPN05662.1 hydroxyacid dehydrogenase [Mesorhizobium sp. B2-3-3]SNX78868.1 Phosphoglycerate dehydrogenase [Streptomyces microflavus]MCX4416751.1 hydroxyacid dehydrogenase [[Kitasatospora] papulosa]